MGQGRYRKLFTASTGLNTVTDPTRINYDTDTGISDLGVAINVTIDETGWVSRREGFERVHPGVVHSMYSDGDLCVFVSSGTLYQLMEDYSSVPLRVLTRNYRMAYTQVNGDFYYTNGVDFGIIQSQGVPLDWVALPYVGQETNRVFDGPRAGNHLAFLGGRVFVAEGNVLWWSEPFAFSWFDRTRSALQFHSDIRMVKAVVEGLFVSDNDYTYFISGTNPREFMQSIVAPYPAIEWSDAIDYIEAQEVGLSSSDLGLCALWASLEGACLGTSKGVFINLNKKKVIYPKVGTFGASLVKGYHFIHSIGG